MLRMDTWRLNVCAVSASQGGFSLDGAIVAHFSWEICRNSEVRKDFFLFFGISRGFFREDIGGKENGEWSLGFTGLPGSLRIRRPSGTPYLFIVRFY